MAEAALALGVAMALLAALTLTGDIVTGPIALVIPVGLLGLAALVFNPRLEWSLAIVLLYIGLLDGYLKLSTGSTLAVIGRDILLYGVVAGALIRAALSDERMRLPRYGLHVLVIVVIVFAQTLHPGTPGVRGALGGLRQHLEFVPLFFIGYLCLRSERRLWWLLGGLLVVTAANAVVAVIQYNLTPQQLAGWGPGYADQLLGTGGFVGSARVFADSSGITRVRPPGLGSDSGASGVYGLLALPAGLAFIAVSQSLRGRLFGAAGVAACIAGIIAAQSRGVVLFGVVAVVAYLLLSATTKHAARTAATVLVAGASGAFAISTFAASNESAAFSRLKTVAPGRVQSTILNDRGSSLAAIPVYALRYPGGVGLGRVGPATGFGNANSGLDAETEFNFLIGELGTIGMLAFLALWVRVVLDGVGLVRAGIEPRNRFLYGAILAALITMLAVWFGGPVTAAPPTAPLFWLFLGALAWAVHRPHRG